LIGVSDVSEALLELFFFPSL